MLPGRPGRPPEVAVRGHDRDRVAGPDLPLEERPQVVPHPLGARRAHVDVVEVDEEGAAVLRLERAWRARGRGRGRGPVVPGHDRLHDDRLEARDLARLPVLLDREVGCRQVGDRPPGLVHDDRVDPDEFGCRREAGRLLCEDASACARRAEMRPSMARLTQAIAFRSPSVTSVEVHPSLQSGDEGSAVAAIGGSFGTGVPTVPRDDESTPVANRGQPSSCAGDRPPATARVASARCQRRATRDGRMGWSRRSKPDESLGRHRARSSVAHGGRWHRIC